MKGEVFPHLLKSSELYENLQSNHTHNFGAREYGIAGALHTGAAHWATKTKKLTTLIIASTELSRWPSNPAAKIPDFPKKQKSFQHSEWVFPCQTRGKSHLFTGILSSSIFLGRGQFAPAYINTPRYKVLNCSHAQKAKIPKVKRSILECFSQQGNWNFLMPPFQIFKYYIIQQ